MFKLQSPLNNSPFEQYTYRDIFPTAQNGFWTRQFWCLLLFQLFFVSPLPYWQNVFLWGLFSSGEQNKVSWGEIGWIGRVGHGGHTVFGQKLLNMQHCVDRYAHKSPIMKWANMLKESSKKNSLKLNTASHNNASWYTDTDGFLEHSPVLQGTCPPEDISVSWVHLFYYTWLS